MIGASPAFRLMLDTIAKISRFDAPVLIEGETGTGKELVARAIHDRGSRQGRPFVALNCGGIPDSLVENELFGHRRGAFTDARENHAGLVAVAHTGTLLLDEVDALPPKGQATLLRFLQDHAYRPLGDGREARADVRVLAATNGDLAELCERGVFRRDLLYRLRFFHIRVPPLRERIGDVRLLTDHFLETAAAKYGKQLRPVASDTLAWFERHRWPGNVRELENLVCREFLLCDGNAIRIPTPRECMDVAAHSLATSSYREAKAKVIEQFQAEYLKAALERSGGNITLAARLIGTERRHLGHLLKRHRISVPEGPRLADAPGVGAFTPEVRVPSGPPAHPRKLVRSNG